METYQDLEPHYNKLPEYFTPSIEDIYVGYECEINQESLNPNMGWTPYTVGEGYEDITIARAISETKYGGIRVPYLTISQIVNEGWRLPTEDEDGMHKEDWSCLMLTINDRELVAIHYNKNQMFCGQCKDINTFRKIVKLLNIP